MALGILTVFLCILLAGSSCSASTGVANNDKSKLKLKLIHAVYSSESPLYDNTLSNADRLRKLIALDEARQRYLLQRLAPKLNATKQEAETKVSSWAETPVESGAFIGIGQYLVFMSFGSPQQNVLLIADTGSDLIWLQCSPSLSFSCSTKRRCPKGKGVFQASKSSTFSAIPCSASLCFQVPAPRGRNPPCSLVNPVPCGYSYDYADGSSSSGFLASDTVTVQNSTHGVVDNVAFGCSTRAQGGSFSGAGGVLGLGQGQLSFPQQSGSMYSQTFSYCLNDLVDTPSKSLKRSSFLLMGRPDVTNLFFYTPLINNPLAPTFYYVAVAALRVSNRILPIPPSEWLINVLGNGGTVIDSGSTLSFLRLGAYIPLINAFAATVRLERIPSSASLYQGLELCYKASTNDAFPRLTVDFAAGLSLELPTVNYVVDVAEGVKCLAVRPTLSPFGFNVLGNLMQQGYHVEFDRGSSRIGFARTECAPV